MKERKRSIREEGSMGDGGGGSGQNGHDEPLVIDNPAAKINMGSKNGHTPSSADNLKWVRDATQLNFVEIRQWENDQRKKLSFSFSQVIGPGNVVTIHMAPPNHGQTLVVSQQGNKIILQALTKLDHDGQGRLTFQGGPDFRIRRVVSVDPSGGGIGEFDKALSPSAARPVEVRVELVKE